MTPTTDNRPSIVEVWAPHCSACRAMKPDLDAVSKQYEGSVDLILVDAASEPERVGALGVKGTPTLIALSDGEELFRVTGRKSAEELADMFAAVAERGRPTRLGGNDLVLRVVTGLGLAGAGWVSGPAWPLVGIGVGVVVLGMVAWIRQNKPR